MWCTNVVRQSGDTLAKRLECHWTPMTTRPMPNPVLFSRTTPKIFPISQFERLWTELQKVRKLGKLVTLENEYIKSLCANPEIGPGKFGEAIREKYRKKNPLLKMSGSSSGIFQCAVLGPFRGIGIQFWDYRVINPSLQLNSCKIMW